MKLLQYTLIYEVGIARVEEQLDLIPALDVLEFFNFQFVEMLQVAVFLLFNDGGNLRVVDEGSQQEFGYLLNDLILLIEECSLQFVVFLVLPEKTK